MRTRPLPRRGNERQVHRRSKPSIATELPQVSAGQHTGPRWGRRDDTRHLLGVGGEPAIELAHLVERHGLAIQGWRELEEEHALGVEARVDPASSTRLRTNSPAATSRISDTAICVTTSLRPSRLREVPPPRLASAGTGSTEPRERRDQPAGQRGRDETTSVKASTRASGRKSSEIGRTPEISATRAELPRPRCQASRPTQPGDHQRLGEPVAHEPQPAGAEREAQRGLATPGHRARQHQVGDVGAGDEQHEADNCHEHHQGRDRGREASRPAARLGDSQAARQQLLRKDGSARRRPLRTNAARWVEHGSRLGQRNARLRPRQDAQPGRAVAVP